MLYFQVTEDVELTNKADVVHVRVLYNNDNFDSEQADEVVKIDSLLCDKGCIITIPQTLYDIVNGNITFKDVVAPTVEDIMQRMHHEPSLYSDEDMALLSDVDMLVENSREKHVQSGREYHNDVNSGETGGEYSSPKRARIELESVEEEPGNSSKNDDSITPQNHVFYIVGLAGKKKNQLKHYIGQAITAKNNCNMHWFDFMRKTGTVGEFVWCDADSGLINNTEVVKRLSNPTENKGSSSRKGKLLFK